MSRQDGLNGILRLTLATTFILFGWLVLLPAISQLPPVANYLQRMDDRGIDASAMFYTELEMNRRF